MWMQPAFSQSFFEKALKKVDKTLESADKLLNGESDKNKVQTTATPQSQVKQSQTATENFSTDLEKTFLRGKVKTIVQQEIWSDGDTPRISTYSYNADGMIERYETEDGVMECSYTMIDGQLRIVDRKITLSDREYASMRWTDVVYMNDIFQRYLDYEKGHSKRETIMYPKIKGIPEETIRYTYLDGGKIVRADKTGDTGVFVPSFYIYNDNGHLVAEYSENMESSPVRELKYDAQGRKIYEKAASGEVYQYTYNENGDPTSCKITNTYGEDEDSETKFSYRYDTQGNWIEKNCESNGEESYSYKRTIEYYQ
jgi:YD repeat-containing protein